MTVTVEPNKQERYKAQGKTVLYYTNVAYHAAHKGAPPPLIIKGTIVQKFPKLGEDIVLEDVYAKDVEFKTMFKDPETGVIASAFTRMEHGGQAMAEYIKEAMKNNIAPEDIKAEVAKLKTTKVLSEVPDDELVAALKQRFPDTPPELLEMLKQDKRAARSTASAVQEKPEDKPAPAAPSVSAASKLQKSKEK